MMMNWEEKNPSCEKLNYSATINKGVTQHGFDWTVEDLMKNKEDNVCRELYYADSPVVHDELSPWRITPLLQ